MLSFLLLRNHFQAQLITLRPEFRAMCAPRVQPEGSERADQQCTVQFASSLKMFSIERMPRSLKSRRVGSEKEARARLNTMAPGTMMLYNFVESEAYYVHPDYISDVQLKIGGSWARDFN